MNILWIEDFGGLLQPNTDTLSSMFQGLISFDEWDEDEVSLLSCPSGLERFFNANSDFHCVYLCRHYFDYAEFKKNHHILKKIDAVIIDIRLDHNVDFDIPIPFHSAEKQKFHNNAGFYIYNDLIHLGVPAEKMCFMTGEKNSFTEFEIKCNDIYIPKVTGFEKNDTEYEKLRAWIQEKNSDYTILRRGVIQGCISLKAEIEKDETKILFRDFIKIVDKKQLPIEIVTADIINYLDALAQFLALKQPDEQQLNVQYRLFLRALVHEWEKNIDPQAIKTKYEDKNINDIYTFAWLSKMTRNWTSHANLLEPLNPQIIAFLFMVTMRAMFEQRKTIKPYEQLLFSCMPEGSINNKSLKDNIQLLENNIDEILAGLKIPDYKEDEKGKKILDRVGNETIKHFGEKINAVYRHNTGNPDAEQHNFQCFLLQYFWVNQKKYLHKLTNSSDNFLPMLARHIYKSTFPKA